MTTVITMTGPGTTTVSLDAVAAALTAQTTAITAELVFIYAATAQINNTLQSMKDNSKLTAKAVSDMQAALGSISTATSSQTVIQAAAASNQIKTNNFQVQATKDALTATGQPLPEIPPIVEQIKETITDSMQMNAIAVAEGAVTNFIVSNAVSVQTWVLNTEVYRDITSWLKQSKDSLVAAIFPKTPAAIESGTKVLAGDPSPTTTA